MTDTVAIVVTYNRCELLKECIECLQNQREADFDILIIDNASTDQTPGYLKKIEGERISVFYMDENVGGAGGFSKGIEIAYAKGYQYFWLMDDDTMPEEEALAQLRAADHKLKAYGFLAGRVNWKDGSLCKMNIPLFLKEEKEGYAKVCKATFVSLFLKREVIADVGLPIAEFFIWGDDQEYTERISRKYSCYYVNDSVVCHKTKINAGSDIVKDDKNRISRYYYKYRNELFISKRKNILSLGYYFVRLLQDTIKIVFSSDYKCQRLKIMYKGMFAGIKFNPHVSKVE